MAVREAGGYMGHRVEELSPSTAGHLVALSLSSKVSGQAAVGGTEVTWLLTPHFAC